MAQLARVMHASTHFCMHDALRPHTARTYAQLRPERTCTGSHIRSNTQPAHAPRALTRRGGDPSLGPADIEIQLNHSPPRGRADAYGGRALYPAPPAHPRRTPPPRNPCWHARVRRARGRSEARVGPTLAAPPPGTERAPPRLIPGEDDRCFLLLAVASPLIPEGG